ncbi:2-phosphosulfolactate phosphatase [Dehalococcoidia bacterium]|nr:2-phosphosulfolactate phosphatase [Dehalococcoidia bacterium]
MLGYPLLMKVHVVSHAAGLRRRNLSGWSTIVIDVVRASSTIAQALASGCEQITPVSSVTQARRSRADSPEVLLGGERMGLKISGFDLGNSPREYTSSLVRGKRIVFTTTNGTRALRAAVGAGEVLVGAFVNLPAVVQEAVGKGLDILVAPVGRGNAPVLDDTVCAGMYVDSLIAAGANPTADALVTRMVYLGYRGNVEEGLRQSASGQALLKVGLGDDLKYCAQVGLFDLVPRFKEGRITAIKKSWPYRVRTSLSRFLSGGYFPRSISMIPGRAAFALSFT